MKNFGRRFEWHPAKDRSNKVKHGFGFELASLVFLDPLAVTELEGCEHGEERWCTAGQIGLALVLVSHTTRDEDGIEVIRIISARKATSRERRRYEEDS